MEDQNVLRLEALRLLREWGVWMVAVQTALISFLISLLLQSKLQLGSVYIKGSVSCFGISIACAASLLGALPSITQRLTLDDRSIYTFGLFDLPLLRRIRVGWVSFFQQVLFLLGLLVLLVSVTRGEIG
jgi:hypothetical protein